MPLLADGTISRVSGIIVEIVGADPTEAEAYSLRGYCSTRAEQGGATDVQVSALLSHSRGQNSTYSLASSVGAAMAAAAKHAKAESQRRGLVAIRPRVAAEAGVV